MKRKIKKRNRINFKRTNKQTNKPKRVNGKRKKKENRSEIIKKKEKKEKSEERKKRNET